MLKWLKLKNFTAFPETPRLKFARHLNQVFVATHSLFLLREFEILLKREFGNVKQRYFALRRGAEGVVVSQASEVSDVNPLVLLDQELSQSDRFVQEFMQEVIP